jgi:hypothetical protein
VAQGGNNAYSAQLGDFGYGIAYYDARTGQAIDYDGNPVVDDGSDPRKTSEIEAARQAASANQAEQQQRDAGMQQTGAAQSALSSVQNANFDPMGDATNAALALAQPGRYAGAAEREMALASAAGRNIGAADASNVAAAAAQGKEYGADLGAYRQDIDLLRQTALGQGPSAAQSLAQSQLDQTVRAQAALAAQARGGNVAGGMRAAMQAGNQMQLQAINQFGALRASEQLQGQAQLANAQQGLATAQGARAGVLQTARGNDIARANTQAQAQNTTAGQRVAFAADGTARDTAGYNALSGQNRDNEDARQARARLALGAAGQFTATAAAREADRLARRHGTAMANKAGEMTDKDWVGTAANVGGSVFGSIAKAAGQ